MKNSIAIKFIAILLAAITLVGAVVSAAGIALLGWLNLYSASSYEQWQEREVEERAESLARNVILRYCIDAYSDVPMEVCEQYLWIWTEINYESWIGILPDSYSFAIIDQTGSVVYSEGEDALKGLGYEYTLWASYPVLTDQTQYEDSWYFNGKENYIIFRDSPAYTVRVYMTAESLDHYQGIPVIYIDTLFCVRYWLIAVLAVCLLTFAALAVYLCCAAGKKTGTGEVSPGGLNRVPLDIYLAAGGGICVGLVALAWLILDSWVINESLNVGGLVLATLVLLVVAVVIIGFFFAVAAQAKVSRTYWIRHTLIGTLAILLFRGFRFVFRAIGKLFSLMPMIWQHVLIALGMAFMIFIAVLISYTTDEAVALFFLLHTFVGCLAIICYCGYALGALFKGAKRMREGNLDNKINTRFLLGSYRKAAEDLNALADAAKVSAEKQLKSERMKTELITNVSHDIKTPLTSIINYVDLLEKPHTEEEGRQYLEVLGRQSQRLKKLVDDLMEMSKATTGNMAVEITLVDAAEAVNQALGEFADKLANANLTTVFYQPETPMAMRADGRLVWRVLSNCLSNIVKYALPGTRVYIDIQHLQDRVLISLKNISREPLNVSADELKERFVRGDASRNTDGSGLGLNIAQSLMELQQGRLDLLVDGDLFKVTLSFPAE